MRCWMTDSISPKSVVRLTSKFPRAWRFGFGGAHLELGVVLGDFLAELDQLFVGVLDLLQAVAVGRLVQLQLRLVGGELLFGLLQLEANFEAVARSPALRYALVSASSFWTWAPVGLRLARHALDQPAVLFQPARLP